MKAVILAGGRGTRLSEETRVKPKPMVEIGGQPILWHIMKIYAAHGVTDFVICLGYLGYMIKSYFANYFLHRSDVTIDLGSNEVVYHNSEAEPWRVTLVDTGQDTATGGRIKRIRPHLDPNEPFFLTYGDGVSDIDLSRALAFHRQNGCKVTMTVVAPPGRFGATSLQDDRVVGFREKADTNDSRINAGFFTVEPSAIDFIDGDETWWEHEPLEHMADRGQVAAYRHDGFWQPMDTVRDRERLEQLWQANEAPWKLW
ncbi:glucose-1-phosphate cytidylyltransferase [Marinivivus vitaminiproducens]|uniref:glucose-1-phosphate cytidylyltransferase n=1 Tax=Marinivivus vitaminiproducens TaxID=3035935 RepID=UPI00279C5142|nr:glucose-1-phosphate cytidylyltransferase [Geminicoccaceae bacterium SCSIO 64248]